MACSVGYMTHVDYAVYGTSQGTCGAFHANPYSCELSRHAVKEACVDLLLYRWTRGGDFR